MKYEVKFSCGHTECVELYGKGSDRERKIKYFEEYGECSECRRKEREKGCRRVQMLYKDYKAQYSFCDTVYNSYNSKDKSIIVLVPEALAQFIDAKSKGGKALCDVVVKIIFNNRNKNGKFYKECYDVVKAYVSTHADFAKELQSYVKR